MREVLCNYKKVENNVKEMSTSENTSQCRNKGGSSARLVTVTEDNVESFKVFKYD